mmetsp:Transcript_137932/g.384681  ORF Transcript_137932/g.384681 Transcript_137932/m.384681 type:complete len:262 (-) Transcript_137932:25-810(-)
MVPLPWTPRMLTIGCSSWPALSEGGPQTGGSSPFRVPMLHSCPTKPVQAAMVSDGYLSTVALYGLCIEASITALAAGISVGLLCALGDITHAVFGLPLWAPPLGAVAVIFASEAAVALRERRLLALPDLGEQALRAGSLVVATCTLAVLLTRLLGPSPLGRVVAVAAAGLGGRRFAPVGAFCALFADQAMAQGAMAQLGLLYALFPCGVGTLLLLALTRAVTSAVAGPFWALERAGLVQWQEGGVRVAGTRTGALFQDTLA